MVYANKRQQQRKDEEIIGAQQVADMFGISKQTVIRRAKGGEIPGTKLGNLWLFRRQTVASLVP